MSLCTLDRMIVRAARVLFGEAIKGVHPQTVTYAEAANATQKYGRCVVNRSGEYLIANFESEENAKEFAKTCKLSDVSVGGARVCLRVKQ